VLNAQVLCLCAQPACAILVCLCAQPAWAMLVCLCAQPACAMLVCLQLQSKSGRGASLLEGGAAAGEDRQDGGAEGSGRLSE
jgi:hypothetical protein